jgi:PAS domain S-box-containing protein
MDLAHLVSEVKRTTQEYQRRAAEVEIVAEVAAAVTSILDLRPLLRKVVELAKERFLLYHAQVYLLDAQGQYLVLAAGAGTQGQKMEALQHRIALNRQQSLVARAARTRQPVNVNDVSAEPDFMPHPLLPKTRSELALPMIVGDDVVGVLDFQSDMVGRFDNEDVRVKTILAQQVAVAVRNARAFERIHWQMLLQQASLDIAELLRSAKAPSDDLIDLILVILVEVFAADNAIFLRFDHSQQVWLGVTGIGAGMTRSRARAFASAAPQIPYGQAALRSQRVVLVDDADHYPAFGTERPSDESGSPAVVVLPIVAGELKDGAVFLNFYSHHHGLAPEDIGAARLLSDQISVGLERLNAEVSLAEARERAEMLAQISTALSRAQDEHEILSALAPYTARVGAAWLSLSYIQNDAMQKPHAISTVALCGNDGSRHLLDELPQTQFPAEEHALLRWASRHPDAPLLLDDCAEIARLAADDDLDRFAKRTHIGASIVLPLRVNNRWLGLVSFNWPQAQVFNTSEHEMLVALQAPLVSIIASRRAHLAEAQALKESQQLLHNLVVVQEVGAAISAILDLDSLLQEVVELTKARFELYHVHIYLLDDTRENLMLAAGSGEPGRKMKERTHYIPVDHPNSIVARAARTQQGAFSNDTARSEAFLPNPLLPHTRSEIAVPMIVGGELIGVLDVQSDRLDRFTEIDVLTKTALAQQIAVAVQNARAFAKLVEAQAELIETLSARETAEEKANRRAAELATVAMVSAAASTSLELDELLKTVVELTKTNFDLYHAHIYLLDDKREFLKLASGAGQAGDIMKQHDHKIRADHPHSLVARAARTGQGAVANDITQEPDFLPNPLLPETRSEMAIPMIIGDQVIGILDVQSTVIGRFTDDDILVQTTLASQVAVAMQNARALEQILLLERAVENSASGLSIADARLPDLPLVYVNPAFENITGYRLDEVIGKNCRFLQGDDREQEAIEDIRAAIREQRSCTVTVRNYRKDGTRFWNELRLSPIFSASGEITHYVGVQTDITARQEIEAQREEMLRQAEKQAERFREVDRLKSQFLANMSHELRTPLNSIIGFSEVLLDGDDGALSEEAIEDINTIHQSGKHLLAIINGVLDLAKIEAGQMSIERRPTDLVGIIHEVVQAAHILVRDKPVELIVREETPIPFVIGDLVRLRQIMTNLVSNAAKFTDRGSITVAYGMTDDARVYVDVRDTGIGITQEDLSIIFQQFRQVDGSATRRAEGTGLGLTITKHLVALHGGEIEVQSERGVGSCFRFVMPGAGTHKTRT